MNLFKKLISSACAFAMVASMAVVVQATEPTKPTLVVALEDGYNANGDGVGYITVGLKGSTKDTVYSEGKIGVTALSLQFGFTNINGGIVGQTASLTTNPALGTPLTSMHKKWPDDQGVANGEYRFTFDTQNAAPTPVDDANIDQIYRLKFKVLNTEQPATITFKNTMVTFAKFIYETREGDWGPMEDWYDNGIQVYALDLDTPDTTGTYKELGYSGDLTITLPGEDKTPVEVTVPNADKGVSDADYSTTEKAAWGVASFAVDNDNDVAYNGIEWTIQYKVDAADEFKTATNTYAWANIEAAAKVGLVVTYDTGNFAEVGVVSAKRVQMQNN